MGSDCLWIKEKKKQEVDFNRKLEPLVCQINIKHILRVRNSLGWKSKSILGGKEQEMYISEAEKL